METWLEIDEFCKLVHLDRNVIDKMIEEKKLNSKEENGKILVEASAGTYSLMPSEISLVATGEAKPLAGENFIEKTIGTILNLHEKVLDAKDETLVALRSENQFLKDALFSMQDLYDEDRKTVDTLTTQLKSAQNEVEFLRRKYKLMWNKAVENYKKVE